MKFPPNTNPTPITDAADRVIPGETAYEHSVKRSVAMADLERQLAEAREQRDRLAKACKSAKLCLSGEALPTRHRAILIINAALASMEGTP